MTERRKLLEEYKDKSNYDLKIKHLQLQGEIDDLRDRQLKEAIKDDKHWFDLQEQIDELCKRKQTIERVWFYRNNEPMPFDSNDDQ